MFNIKNIHAGTYSVISDDQLDDLVRQAQQVNPNSGIRLMRGFLRSRGHRVQHTRIREALLRTDPVGLTQRWSQNLRRRTYHVAGPLSLWHIDGNHKLIR